MTVESIENFEDREVWAIKVGSTVCMGYGPRILEQPLKAENFLNPEPQILHL